MPHNTLSQVTSLYCLHEFFRNSSKTPSASTGIFPFRARVLMIHLCRDGSLLAVCLWLLGPRSFTRI